MKLYIISGLGADEKVLEKLTFDFEIEPVHIPWLIPEKKEDFHHYIRRMAENIDDSEEFYLLGYSFGGILVQEIHNIKPAKKIVILGSIRCDKEKPILMEISGKINIIKYLPLALFNSSNPFFYTFFKKIFDAENAGLTNYFRVRDPYYLKWSSHKISRWKFEKITGVIQILADRDIIFPIKNSQPDFVVRNATHLFPLTKHREVSNLLKSIFMDFKTEKGK